MEMIIAREHFKTLILIINSDPRLHLLHTDADLVMIKTRVGHIMFMCMTDLAWCDDQVEFKWPQQ